MGRKDPLRELATPTNPPPIPREQETTNSYQDASGVEMGNGDPILHCGHLDQQQWKIKKHHDSPPTRLKNGYIVYALFSAACSNCMNAPGVTPVLSQFSTWDASIGKPSANGSLPLR